MFLKVSNRCEREMNCKTPSPAENELWSLLICWDPRDTEYNGTLSTGDIP